VCAAVAADEGISRSVVPEQWRLGALVRDVAQELLHRRWVLTADGHRGLVQGSLVVLDGTEIVLDADQRSLLGALGVPGGGTVAADPERVAGLQEVLGPLGPAVVAAEDGWQLAVGARQPATDAVVVASGG
jgi:hypothetical protein